jgi:acid phosphatase family membrane protein YuiD
VTRIPGHTIADAPAAARPLLEGVAPFSPTGKLLNLHAQIAHSPAVLAAYVSIRQATAAHGTLEPRVRSALMLATAGVSHSVYAAAVTSMLALRSGWSPAQVARLRDGYPLGEDKADSLVRVVREAAMRAGQVGDLAWRQAAACGWSSEELAEAFAYLALTVFTAYFLNYAQTPLDLPAGAAAAGRGTSKTEPARTPAELPADAPIASGRE